MTKKSLDVLSASSSSNVDWAELRLRARRYAQRSWLWARGPGRQSAITLSTRLVRQIKRNLTSRRIVSFPHLLVLFWMVILLWGERWIFESKVDSCAWDEWENWPPGAHPHHLIFVADPQIIDQHSYPSRIWPITTLTMRVTDNYLRRGYGALQSKLRPDSVFFLGDLFDGGREWKTRAGTGFVDPKWGTVPRPKDEARYAESWRRKYGETHWLREYKRFGDIFFDKWSEGGDSPGAWQRGRKLVAGLPGNHDIGFGAQVQVPVRDRFSTFFGDLNRVDVVGNHTIVSVDGVSMSADTSTFAGEHDLTDLFGPVNSFLDGVKTTKRKMAQKEVELWHGKQRDLRYYHAVENLAESDLSKLPDEDPGPSGADFPTILLTHVPLYRLPGTPCGPKREHWPPTRPPSGQSEPVVPDDRNAIAVAAGYQYQNVLNEEDSVRLIQDVGNVVHVFSGDDHDYCEVVHSPAKNNVREITVKSLSMAMGVQNPGFVMVSLYNPIDADGKTMSSSGGGGGGGQQPTLQTHLCLLPNQFHTYLRYVTFAIVTLVLLSVRAYLVPVLHLTPFALEPEASASPAYQLLPTHKDKLDPPDLSQGEHASSPMVTSGTSSTNLPSRFRSPSGVPNGMSASSRWTAKRQHPGRGDRGWDVGGGGGGRGGTGPRIDLNRHIFYSDSADKGWRGAHGRVMLGTVGRELVATIWRTSWMAVSFWLYLTYRE